MLAYLSEPLPQVLQINCAIVGEPGEVIIPPNILLPRFLRYYSPEPSGAEVRFFHDELRELEGLLLKAQISFLDERKRLRENHASSEEFMALDANEHYEIQGIESRIDFTLSLRVMGKARSLDVEIPPVSDQQMWAQDPDGEYRWLSVKGRAHVHKLIYEEQERRLELRAKRFTVWAPLITALTGLAGVLLGIIAVLHNKK